MTNSNARDAIHDDLPASRRIALRESNLASAKRKYTRTNLNFRDRHRAVWNFSIAMDAESRIVNGATIDADFREPADWSSSFVVFLARETRRSS